jgi:hypothetical protein
MLMKLSEGALLFFLSKYCTSATLSVFVVSDVSILIITIVIINIIIAACLCLPKQLYAFYHKARGCSRPEITL